MSNEEKLIQILQPYFLFEIKSILSVIENILSQIETKNIQVKKALLNLIINDITSWDAQNTNKVQIINDRIIKISKQNIETLNNLLKNTFQERNSGKNNKSIMDIILQTFKLLSLFIGKEPYSISKWFTIIIPACIKSSISIETVYTNKKGGGEIEKTITDQLNVNPNLNNFVDNNPDNISIKMPNMNFSNISDNIPITSENINGSLNIENIYSSSLIGGGITQLSKTEQSFKNDIIDTPIINAQKIEMSENLKPRKFKLNREIMDKTGLKDRSVHNAVSL